MKTLTVAISAYVMGLLVFYVCAAFDMYYWYIIYFGWSKLFDCGLFFWLSIYYILPKERKVIKWLLYFSVIRFLWDIQSFFTGLGVNNEVWMAILFLVLLLIAVYLSMKPDGKAATFLSKHLNI